ncbi:hypothetical protein [Cellvibrio sp. OA-2007]|uniref:hypothetical protein n=1 Tax=Cellvibrio sp. OA-2007 TaxID=529823 RepID=UPI000783F3B0|nr:hypothetical protein [Cellvibrio sp. OA-2007]
MDSNKRKSSSFVVAGILAPTGAPVDKSLCISLAGMAAIHEERQTGVQILSTQKSAAHRSDSDAHHQHSAEPAYLFMLIASEVFLMCLVSVASAELLLIACIKLLQPWLISEWGLHIAASVFTIQQAQYLLAVFIIALVLAVIPSLLASWRSLANGLTVRH